MDPMEKKPDIFDKIMGLPLLRLLKPFYLAHKEKLLYLFFGGLTTLVSLVSFALANGPLGLNEHIANVLSWVLAVLFAFVTNRIWVFGAAGAGLRELSVQMCAFFGGRLATLGFEELILLAFVTWLRVPALPVKVAALVAVVILNYVISKRFVFRQRMR